MPHRHNRFRTASYKWSCCKSYWCKVETQPFRWMILVSPLAFIMSVGQRSALIIGSWSDFGQRSRLTRRTRPQCLSFAEYPAFRPCRRQNYCFATYKRRQALGLIVQENFGCCTLLRRAHCTAKLRFWLFSSVPRRLGHTWIHTVHERYDTTGFETANACNCNWLHKLKCTRLKLAAMHYRQMKGRWHGMDWFPVNSVHPASICVFSTKLQISVLTPGSVQQTLQRARIFRQNAFHAHSFRTLCSPSSVQT